MYSLLAYGSLLHPDELARHGLEPASCTPVRVRGFLRSFCQEPSWRPATSDARAVLTVEPSDEHWINALRIRGFDSDAVAELDHRERGYSRAAVHASRIEIYGPRPAPGPDAGAAAVIYAGREEKFNAEILPAEDYLQLCLSGAAAWGEEFLADFLRSTFVQERVPLLDHRPDLEHRLLLE